MYKKSNMYLKGSVLVVNKEEYRLSRMLNIRAKELRLKDQLIRILSISLALSVFGWIILPITGPILMLVGALIAVFTMKKYELCVEIRATDESGDQWIPIARGRKPEEFLLFKNTAELVAGYLK
ncbi:hypothetical protein C942_00201 [Photobacterium marinum]|uniref:Uncharacterized protein n=2 Tax=Photobacterium marinum TaxID=1056511 RepID=L8JI36_9GAMM|nr:hypothetical protein C942_00201 [Photobacterium marinum]